MKQIFPVVHQIFSTIFQCINFLRFKIVSNIACYQHPLSRHQFSASWWHFRYYNTSRTSSTTQNWLVLSIHVLLSSNMSLIKHTQIFTHSMIVSDSSLPMMITLNCNYTCFAFSIIFVITLLAAGCSLHREACAFVGVGGGTGWLQIDNQNNVSNCRYKLACFWLVIDSGNPCLTSSHSKDDSSRECVRIVYKCQTVNLIECLNMMQKI